MKSIDGKDLPSGVPFLFQLRPVVVEAIQFIDDPACIESICKLVDDSYDVVVDYSTSDPHMIIRTCEESDGDTHECWHLAAGDWVLIFASNSILPVTEDHIAQMAEHVNRPGGEV